MDAATQIEHAYAAVASHQLTQSHVNRFALGSGPDQLLSLIQNGIIDLNVCTHTPENTHQRV
jgi:hypothetical protein